MLNDLALAQSAIAREPEGLRAFEALVSTLRVSDEVRQLVRKRSLVDGKLCEFDGRGSLRSWLKTVAARLEVDLRRSTREDPVEDRVLSRLLPPCSGFEAELVTTEARVVLRASVRSSLDALPTRTRLWLTHYYLDGLTLTRIGALYNVAPSTVMRSLEKAVVELKALVCRHLRESHLFGATSVDSLIRFGVA